jgi:hypothetical protein
MQAEDLYDLVPDERALRCETKWLKAMEEEKAKTNRTHVSVWKLLYKSMGNKFMLGSLYKPVWLVAVVLQVRNFLCPSWEIDSKSLDGYVV